MASSDPFDEKGLIIFGQDVTKIPCFRNSFLYGISGGIGCGLAYFLFTSRIKRANDVAVGSFAIITLSYWFHCRYRFSKEKAELSRVQFLLRQRILYDGTEQEELLDKKLLNQPVDV